MQYGSVNAIALCAVVGDGGILQLFIAINYQLCSNIWRFCRNSLWYVHHARFVKPWNMSAKQHVSIAPLAFASDLVPHKSIRGTSLTR